MFVFAMSLLYQVIVGLGHMTFESVPDSLHQTEASTTEAENCTSVGDKDGSVYDEDGEFNAQSLSLSPPSTSLSRYL